MEAPCKVTQGKQESRASIEQKITKVTHLKLGQLVFVKDHQKGTFNPSYVYDHRVEGILNDSTVVPTNPDGKKRCNIHNIKPMTPLEA